MGHKIRQKNQTNNRTKYQTKKSDISQIIEQIIGQKNWIGQIIEQIIGQIIGQIISQKNRTSFCWKTCSVPLILIPANCTENPETSDRNGRTDIRVALLD